MTHSIRVDLTRSVVVQGLTAILSSHQCLRKTSHKMQAELMPSVPAQYSQNTYSETMLLLEHYCGQNPGKALAERTHKERVWGNSIKMCAKPIQYPKESCVSFSSIFVRAG
jgi:hypothetical protein